MVVATLAFSAAVQLIAAVAFLIVGRTVLGREVSADARWPQVAFATWWWGMGAYMVLQGGLTLLAALDQAPYVLHLAARGVSAPLLCGAVWGLTYHVLYLYSGAARLAVPLGLLYGLLSLVFLFASFSPMPGAVSVEPWLVELEGTGATPLYRVVYAAIGIPPILLTIAYATLWRSTNDPHRRWRIALVSLALGGWIASGLAARLAGGDVVKFVTLAVFGLGAAIAVLAAYHPPRRVTAWLDACRPPAA